MSATTATRQIFDILKDLEDHPQARPVVFVLRGLPGCGKTWMAQNLQAWCQHMRLSVAICSADHWFERGGYYRYRGNEVEKAHTHCKGTFLYYMSEQTRVIVVDNTNLRTGDYLYYVEGAREHYYDPIVVEYHVESEEQAWFVANRSTRLRDVEAYDPWSRWCRFSSDPAAIVLAPQGMEIDQERALEWHERGYV